MEVHSHTHTARKKWTHYFWEFLMLFLAVFCGFLAEYQLEHKIEKSREKQYIRSFVEDLEADTVDIESRMRVCDRTVTIADSLVIMLSSPDPGMFANEIYFYLRTVHRSNPFNVNDRTIVQLRNAGGMRLVTNKAVSDSMVAYYKMVDFVQYIHEEQIEIKRSLRPHFYKLLDGAEYGKVIDNQNRVIRTTEPMTLRKANEETLNQFIIILQNIKGINQGTKLRLSELREKAKAIREFTIEEYNL